MPVRRRTPTLTAVKVVTPQTVDLPTGEQVFVRSGDWIITAGQQIVDWSGSAALSTHYERVQTAKLEISPETAQRLERTLGLGATRDAYSLVDAVERLARISIGSVVVEFTPGQLEEIKHRASKRGHSVAEELRAVVDRVKDDIFHRG